MTPVHRVAAAGATTPGVVTVGRREGWSYILTATAVPSSGDGGGGYIGGGRGVGGVWKRRQGGLAGGA